MAGTDFVGDDLAQMWVGEDGTMRAINPEQGIFGIVADVNREGQVDIADLIALQLSTTPSAPAASLVSPDPGRRQ